MLAPPSQKGRNVSQTLRISSAKKNLAAGLVLTALTVAVLVRQGVFADSSAPKYGEKIPDDLLFTIRSGNSDPALQWATCAGATRVPSDIARADRSRNDKSVNDLRSRRRKR
jgi:hypothetical protein